MELRVLGPVEVWAHGERREIGWALERVVLAALLLAIGQPVSVEALVERVWDNPPPRARALLHPHITRLRSGLQGLGDDVRLFHRSGAYVLDVPKNRIDVYRFRMLRQQAREAAAEGDAPRAIGLYREAAELRRGEPLSGLPGGWAARVRSHLEDELMSATVERIELELRLGHHADVLAELAELAGRFPFDEKLVELRMLALYRCGRQADALKAFQQARTRLVAELGAEAGPALRDLHQRILRADPGLVPHPGRKAVPANLPRDPLSFLSFTGRAAELTELTAFAGQTSPAVLTIDGMAGVGKSALAVRLAYLLSDGYPDGRLYLDFHGHRAGQAPLGLDAALERLLGLLGVPRNDAPRSADALGDLWRAELSRRRLLVVFDDVVDHALVQELLPGRGDYLAIVTSRHRPTVLDSGPPLSLDVLPEPDAVELLRRIVGPQRAVNAQELGEVVRLCGYLPLAIQLAGRRLRNRPAWTVADLRVRLALAPVRLTELRAGGGPGNGGAGELSAAFALSYEGLGPGERWTFRRLALHPGSDLSAPVAGALLDLPPDAAERLLETLLDHNLLTETRPGRYRFHDLIAEYAGMLLAADPAAEREVALDRLFRHYLRESRTAVALRYPHRAEAAPESGDMDDPGRWLAQETGNMVRILQSDAGRSAAGALLAHVLAPHLEAAGFWAEGAVAHERAVEVWRAGGDRRGLARALADLGTVLRRLGRHQEALKHAGEALALFREVGDRRAVAAVLDVIGQVHWNLSEFDVSYGYIREALDIRQDLGDVQGAAECLAHLAIVSWHRGDYVAAIDSFSQAQSLYAAAGDERGVLMTENNLGDVELTRGNYSKAREHLENASAIVDGGRQYRAIWTNNMGKVEHAAGDLEQALRNYHSALDIYREIGDQRSETETLISVGQCFLDMARDGEGLAHFQQAYHLAREIGERSAEGAAVRGIGLAYDRAGRHEAALEHFRQALDVARTIGEGYLEARTLDAIGTTLTQTGNQQLGTQYRTQALEMYEGLGVPEAATLRALLTRPKGAATS